MRAITVATLAGLGLVLSGCGATNPDVGTASRGLEPVHQPVVPRSDYVFDVSAGGGGLAPNEAGRLQGWFDTLGLGYGDRVAVDMGDGYASGVREDVAGIVARYGLLIDDTAPITSGAIAPGSVRVVVSRMKASMPGCPDWGRSISDDFENHTYPNYGCAVNGNLAAMVANPADLVSGQAGGSTVDARTAGKAIKSYRDRKPTGEGDLKKENAGGNQ